MMYNKKLADFLSAIPLTYFLYLFQRVFVMMLTCLSRLSLWFMSDDAAGSENTITPKKPTDLDNAAVHITLTP